MNTKRIIVLGFALVAASAAALLARGLMGGGTPKVEAKIAPAPVIAMSEVLVANSNIQPGLTLTPDMVKWQSWPASAVDASFITHAAAPSLEDAVKGTVVRVPLYAGQPITTLAIVHGASAGFMAAQLQPGMRAVSITISVDSGAGGFILPNDRIDLMLTTKTNDSPPHVTVKTILGDVRVLAVDQTFKEDKDTKTVVGKTATLELTPEQAELVAAAQTLDHQVQPLEIVAVVGVAHDHEAAAGGVDAADQGRAIAALGNGRDAGAMILGDQLRAVGRSVVGDQHLADDARTGQEAAGLVDAHRQGLRLVEAGHQDSEFDGAVVCRRLQARLFGQLNGCSSHSSTPRRRRCGVCAKSRDAGYRFNIL